MTGNMARAEAVAVGETVKIAVVGPHAPYRGGIAHFTDRICSEFEASGFDVVKVSFSRLYPEALFPGQTQYEPGTPDDWASDWTSSGNNHILIDSVNPVSWLAGARKIKDAGVQTVLFMYWMPYFAPAFTAIARIAQNAGIKTLAIVHNALPHERHIGDAALSDVFFSRCDAVCALSESVAADIKTLESAPDAQIIPHPVYDHFGENIDQAEARKQLGIDTDARVLLFFGLIRKYKGLNVLLDAFALVRDRLPGIKLIVAGEFYDDPEPYKTQIKELDLSDSILLIDRYIEEAMVPVVFSAADVVVQPYLSATQSGVVQIAIHFERPSIVTDVGGLEEAIGSRNAGLVVPAGNSGALADALEHFFSAGVDERLTAGVRELKAASTWSDFVLFVQREINKT